jgi:hypothetical protein
MKVSANSSQGVFWRASYSTTGPRQADDATEDLLTVKSKQGIPPLKLKWYYATTNPLRYPAEYGAVKATKKEPVKFSAFNEQDSARLEKKYRELQEVAGPLQKEDETKGFKVEVNEDHLFEVDLVKMEMAPIYWSGAIYGVRRGTWFTNDGIPLSESLSRELEKGYLKIRPFEERKELKGKKTANPLKKFENAVSDETLLYGLEGEFDEGNKVVYTNARSAYVIDDKYVGSLQLVNMLKNLELASGLGATRVIRGFKEDPKSNPPSGGKTDTVSIFQAELSQLFGYGVFGKSKQDEASTQKTRELEITEDYNKDTPSAVPGKRKINHLILCIHGIGQILGTELQTVNFIHTVNLLRKNMHKAYSNSQKSKDHTNTTTTDADNSGVQVLPIIWRHKVDFKADTYLSDKLPSLEDLTVNEIKPIRSLVGSVLLDVLLYYEPYYLKQILGEVTNQANSIYREFKSRNPDFDGKVSIVGHSLGSVIGFDLLSSQYPDVGGTLHEESIKPLQFEFPVENYFALGSPIGVFNLLRRKSISARDDLESNQDKFPADFVSQPKCESFYNVFHPCDPVSYKVEPLISPSLRNLKPASLGIETMVDDLNRRLTSLGEKIGTFKWDPPKDAAGDASSWGKLMSGHTEGVVKLLSLGGTQEVIDSKKNSETKEEGEKQQVEEKNTDPEEKKEKPSTVKLTDEQLRKLTALNYNGRVDYALDQGFLDLSIISSISAHVSYFEDENTASFILKESLVKEKTKVRELKVSLENDKD